jgi:hypothetical protein
LRDQKAIGRKLKWADPNTWELVQNAFSNLSETKRNNYQIAAEGTKGLARQNRKKRKAEAEHIDAPPALTTADSESHLAVMQGALVATHPVDSLPVVPIVVDVGGELVSVTDKLPITEQMRPMCLNNITMDRIFRLCSMF